MNRDCSSLRLSAISKVPASRHQAFTLIELIIAITIISIIASFTVPSFSDFIMDTRMTARINEMVAHLHLARSEAIKRAENIALCPLDDSSCAKTANWDKGWLIFADKNHNRERDQDEEIIKMINLPEGKMTIRSGKRKRIIYHPQGDSHGYTATLTFCDQRGSDKARAIILSNPGRPRISLKSAGGGPLSCA